MEPCLLINLKTFGQNFVTLAPKFLTFSNPMARITVLLEVNFFHVKKNNQSETNL